MKRIWTVCAVLIAMSTAFFVPTALAADSEAFYPTSITVSEDGTELRKVYDLSPEADPGGIPRSDFELNGFAYTFVDILRQELPEYEERHHTETVTLDSKKKDMESVLALLPQEREVVTEDGLSGLLTLKLDSVRVEVAGYGSSSQKVTATRTYPNLDGQDTSYIPKTIEDDGHTLTLQTVNWQMTGTDGVERYTATATYSGTAKSSYVSGYTVTAEYEGTVSRVALNRVRYVAIFSGVSLAPAEPEEPDEPETPADETLLPTPDEGNQETQTGQEKPETSGKSDEAETQSLKFPWGLVFAGLGGIALAGAVLGVTLLVRRRSEADYEDEEENK